MSHTGPIPESPPVTPAGSPRAPAWAWTLCWLMFVCTALNYMDRQAMAVLGPQIKERFGLDNIGFGWVLAAFQLTYAFFQWPAGFLVDRWPVRRTYALAVAWWSLAGLATAFAPGLGALVVCRILLGMGESFNWPCALRVTSGVLPPADRSLGNGIFNSGAAVGAVLTPLLVVPLANRTGWRPAFALLGLAGLAWVVLWLTKTRGAGARHLAEATPRRAATADQRGLRPRGRLAFGLLLLAALATAASAYWNGAPAIWWGIALLMVGILVLARLLPTSDLAGSDWAASLASIVRRRRFWVILSVGVTINVSWHFLVNWMALFFQEERRLGPLVGGLVVALPFLAADVGNLAGGWATRRLARQGRSPVRARQIVLVGCMLLISCAVWVGRARSDALVIGLLCLTALGAAAYMVNYFAFCQDVAPAHTGLVVGYLGGLGNLFAAGFLPLAGWISQKYGGMAPNFVIIGLLPLIGLATLLLAWGPEPVEQAGP